MNTMKFKLEEVSDSYTVFENNQVLTSGQLNRAIEYLDDQNRLTRVNLLGVGIICGLVPSFHTDNIKVSKGCAVTTDGDLIRYYNNMEFETFTEFQDENASYNPFIKNGKQITLLELHDSNSKTPGRKPIKNLPAATIKNSVVVLYLESYLFDPDICTGSDCDNMGKLQRNNLKALLVNVRDIENLSKILPSMFDCYSKLKSIKIKRILLQNQSVGTLKLLSESYTKSMEKSVGDLSRLLKNNFQSCKLLLSEIWEDNPPFDMWGNVIQKLFSEVKNKNTGFQYYYDFLKDFMAGLNEFMDEIYDNNYYCTPDYTLFPKHVCLGGFKNIDQGGFDTHRHGLYPSPLIKNFDIKKLRFLFIRLHRMIININVFINNTTIIILPDRICCPKLSEKVIPMYYDYNSSNPLHESWNYIYNNRSRNEEILSFFANKYAENPQTRDPLSYEFDDCRFFKIGGHIGWNIDEAESEINKQVKNYNLPIKVMSLQIENNLKLIPLKPSRRFRDVRILHKVYRQDLNRNLNNLSLFNNRLVHQVSSAPEKPPETSRDPKNTFKDYSVDRINNLGERIDQIKTSLSKKSTEFNYGQFETDYKSAVNKASSVNKSIRGVTFTYTNTPYDLMINQSKLNTLKWLDNILVKEVEKTKEMSVLEKFLEENPGMEHFAGVPWGGTFILVYSASTNKVVADFSLPYWYCECAKDEEIEENVEEEEDPIKWPDFNDVIIDFDKTETIFDKFDTVEGVIDNTKIELDKSITDKITNLNSTITNTINGVNTTINNKINDVDNKIDSKYSELDVKYNERVSGVTARFDDNKEILNQYAANFQNLIDTTATLRLGGTSGFTLDAGAGYQKEDLGSVARVMDATKEYVKTLNDKEHAGTITTAEKASRKAMEEAANGVVVNALKMINKSGADISIGSDEAKLLKTAAESSEFLSAGAKRALKVEVEAVKAETGDKVEFARMLDNFRF